MATASYSGKLSKDTVFQSDNDDIMAKIWQVRKENEKMQHEIEKCSMEVDGWLQVLECTTEGELEELTDEFSASSLLPETLKITYPSPERDQLLQHLDLANNLCANDMMDPAQGYTTLDGNLFLKFSMRPPKRLNWDLVILLEPHEDDGTYSVLSHNLPTIVPLNEIENEYLKNGNSEDGLKRFIAVVSQYTKALHTRLQDVILLESFNDPKVSSVLYNKGVTNLCFTIDMKVDEENEVMAEFILKFHPLDICPYSVKAAPIKLDPDVSLPPTFQASLDDLAAKMTDERFSLVLVAANVVTPDWSSSQHTLTQSSQTHGSDEEGEEEVEDSGPLFDTQE